MVRPVRVLVVDDEEDMRLLVSTVLSDGFHVIAEAADGAEALSAWQAETPDVMVLDYRMPGLNGIEVAARILRDDPDAIIVLFSAFLTDEMREEARLLGVRGCLPKSHVFELPGMVRGLVV